MRIYHSARDCNENPFSCFKLKDCSEKPDLKGSAQTFFFKVMQKIKVVFKNVKLQMSLQQMEFKIGFFLWKCLSR
jgi:hypothetical protein